MQSADLARYGRPSWYPFTIEGKDALLGALPAEPGVYVIRQRTSIGRFRGQSDIAYIGSATNTKGLRHRVYQYFHAGSTQTTNQRIFAVIASSAAFELAFVSCASPDKARELETILLAQYESDHAELPPLNRHQ